jgi:hypothetical protein
MDMQSLKIDIIHWLTELTDKNVLEKIDAIKKETELDLSQSQQVELEKRLKKYELGEGEFKSWEETKVSIRKRSKDAL